MNDAQLDLKYKCYILLREDLEMPTGKFAVQVGHGMDLVWSQYNMFNSLSGHSHLVGGFNEWFQEGRRKIVLKLKDAEHMESIKVKISEEKNPNYFVMNIMDYGFNFFEGLTQTGLIIYPNCEEIKALKRLRCW